MEAEYEKIDSEKYRESWDDLKSADGILVPGGFGTRGTEGKIAAAKYARENKVPYLGKIDSFIEYYERTLLAYIIIFYIYLGICLGLQLAVIEFARNVCGLEGI